MEHCKLSSSVIFLQMALSHTLRRDDPQWEVHYCQVLSGHPADISCIETFARHMLDTLDPTGDKPQALDSGTSFFIGTQVKRKAVM